MSSQLTTNDIDNDLYPSVKVIDTIIEDEGISVSVWRKGECGHWMPDPGKRGRKLVSAFAAPERATMRCKHCWKSGRR